MSGNMRKRKLCILCYSKYARWRFWSDCANAQAYLNVHRAEGMFTEVATQIILPWEKIRCTDYFFSLWGLFEVYRRCYLTLLLLNTTCPLLANNVDPDQMEANWSGSARFVIKYVNFYQNPRSSNLIGWEIRSGRSISIYSARQELR